jgi:hypothetical protein
MSVLPSSRRRSVALAATAGILTAGLVVPAATAKPAYQDDAITSSLRAVPDVEGPIRETEDSYPCSTKRCCPSSPVSTSSGVHRPGSPAGGSPQPRSSPCSG